jgi:hypothetical protein
VGIAVINPTDLKNTAASYIYDAQAFTPFEQVLWSRMQGYAGTFGQAMVEHLSRTSTHLYGALLHLGYDKKTAQNLSHAFRVHDAGKVLQDESLWGLEDKPSDEIRKQRPAHTDLGVTLLDEVLEKFPNLKDHPHTKIIACFMKYHHERINGKGPQGLSENELGDVLEIAGIVDCVDGKSQLRAKDIPARPGDIEKLVKDKKAQALRDMTGLLAYTELDKHKGEFRTGLLMDIIPYYEHVMGMGVLPPLPISAAGA